jgi:hypothetical protein
MVNFKSPAVAEQDFNVVLKHFWHVTHGIFIWEYLTTFGYEWDVIRGRRPYRWTIWIYSLTRAGTLISVWTSLQLVSGYIGLVAASVLIVFRIVAIWNKNKLIVGITTAVWLANVGVIIQGIVRIRSKWDPLLQSCVVPNTEDNKPNIVLTFISDVILLVIVLVGLLILRHESGIVFPLGRLLWNQGIIWLAIATIAEAPPVVFIILNLNDSWNLMFQFPSLIAMTIAATRMYHSLSDFFSKSTDILSHGSPQRGHDRPANTRATIQLNPIEVAIDVAYERHHITCKDEQLDDNSHKSKVGSDLESAMENRF